MLTTGCNEACRRWPDRSDRLFPLLSSCRALRSRFVDKEERAQIPSRLGEDFSSARQSRIYACNPFLSPPCEAVVVHGAGSIYARSANDWEGVKGHGPREMPIWSPQ